MRSAWIARLARTLQTGAASENQQRTSRVRSAQLQLVPERNLYLRTACGGSAPDVTLTMTLPGVRRTESGGRALRRNFSGKFSSREIWKIFSGFRNARCALDS